MDRINCLQLQSLAKEADKNQSIPAFFELFEDKYRAGFKNQQFSTIKQKAERINNNIKGQKQEKQQFQVSLKKSQHFQRDELHIFKWVLAMYCKVHSLQLEEIIEPSFVENQFPLVQGISQIFMTRQSAFIKYQITSLLNQKGKKSKEWTEEEQNLLQSIMKRLEEQEEHQNELEDQTINTHDPSWSQISYLLYEQSEDQYFRSSVQCKEKWLNHMSQDIKRQKWKAEEAIQLLKLVQTLGRKWSDICKSLKGKRTQHMVRNEFHRLQKFWKKQARTKTLGKKWIDKCISHIQKKKNTQSFQIELNNISSDSFSSSQKQQNLSSQKEKVQINPLLETFSMNNYEKEQQGSLKFDETQKKPYQQYLKPYSLLEKWLTPKQLEQSVGEKRREGRDLKNCLQESEKFEIHEEMLDEDEFGN